jgi:hypothetical protein
MIADLTKSNDEGEFKKNLGKVARITNKLTTNALTKNWALTLFNGSSSFAKTASNFLSKYLNIL